jgi:hypothetical protein
VFISQLRLEWLEMAIHRMRSASEENAPLVIQLAGSNDTGASPDDDIDLLILDAAQGTDSSQDRFVYQTLLESDHFSVLNVLDHKDSAAAKRWEVVKGALFGTREDQVALDETKLIASTEGTLSNRKGIREKVATATDVVFVLHGIRDLGFWTSKLARKIQLEVMNEGKKEGNLEGNEEGKKEGNKEATGSGDCGAAALDQKWHFRSLGTAYGYFGALQVPHFKNVLLGWCSSSGSPSNADSLKAAIRLSDAIGVSYWLYSLDVATWRASTRGSGGIPRQNGRVLMWYALLLCVKATSLRSE